MGHLLAAEVRDALAAAADPAKAPKMQAYMKSALPYRGVPVPQVRRICRALCRSTTFDSAAEWRETVLELWEEATHREEWYAAIDVAGFRGYSAFRTPETLALYEQLIRAGAWWDVVDSTSRLVGDLLRDYRRPIDPAIRAWAAGDDLWLRRSAIICQVGHGADVDEALLAFAIEQNLDGSTRTTPPASTYGAEFFIRKAIGWALRDHARVAPGWVRGFVATHEPQLSGLSRREALKHL